ncbi:hypothetical protein [Sphingobacterium sp. LRF_L2]|uniref:hypothetical protein n=1 Tax=Sphingobacterium sp. LRF_L2 TaxID=3369421 RepID=UPI003F5F0D7B
MKIVQKHYFAQQDSEVLSQQERLSDWRHQLLDLPEDKLLELVRSMPRLKLIEWLAWNDIHGIFLDEDAISEGYPPLTREQAMMCVFAVVMRNRDGWNGYMGDVNLKDLDLAVSL